MQPDATLPTLQTHVTATASVLDTLSRDVHRLMGTVEALDARYTALTTEVADLTASLDVRTLTKAALESLLKVVSAEGLGQVEQLVTYGLQTVFPDRGLQLQTTVSTKRNVQSVELRLVHGDIEGTIVDSFGGGPASVVGFLLRLLVIRRLQLAPLLLLDETFSHVSDQYVPHVAALLREIADKLGMTVLLVSHQSQFVQYATRAYEVVEGSAGNTFREITDGLSR